MDFTLYILSLRKFIFLLAIIGMCCSGCSGHKEDDKPEHARNTYIIGISPFLDEVSSDQIFKQIIRLFLDDMPLNSTLTVYDAYYLKTVAHIHIPDMPAFQSSRTRINQFKRPIQNLKSFLSQVRTKSPLGGISFKDAVNLPQFAEFLGEKISHDTGNVILLVLGSPLYVDEKEPGFTMAGDLYPTDGHLLASKDQTIYGKPDSIRSFPKAALHFGYFGDPWKNELHRQKISRFWKLFFQLRGTDLISMSSDLPTVFNLSHLEPASEYRQDLPINDSEDIAMLHASRDIHVADWIFQELPDPQSILPPVTSFGTMKIGIRWNADVDLDLYARPHGDSRELYFENSEIPEGQYYKDHRSSPDRDYEFIEFFKPIDLRKVESRINFFESMNDQVVVGEIRIEFNNRIYSSPFELEARHGNHGMEGPGQEEFWYAIDIPGILKMN